MNIIRAGLLLVAALVLLGCGGIRVTTVPPSHPYYEPRPPEVIHTTVGQWRRLSKSGVCERWINPGYGRYRFLCNGNRLQISGADVGLIVPLWIARHARKRDLLDCYFADEQIHGRWLYDCYTEGRG